MSMFLKKSVQIVALFGVGSVSLFSMPDYAAESEGRCLACHGTPIDEQSLNLSWGGVNDGEVLDGLIEIPNQIKQLDLGTQLDGSVLGLLEVFEVMPGEDVQLSIKLLDGEERHAVSLVGLQNGGQQNSESNKIAYTADETWTEEATFSNPSFSYYHAGIEDEQSPKTLTYNLLVHESTPADVYKLTFQIGRVSGVQLSYQEQSFYLKVGGEEETPDAPELIIAKSVDGFVLEFPVDERVESMETLLQSSSNYKDWVSVAKRDTSLEILDSNVVKSIDESGGKVTIVLNEPIIDSVAYRLWVQ